MSAEHTEQTITFDDFNLIEPLQKALKRVGYEKPSPIQAQAIPHLLAGKDLLGVAQTGTGKTAAFALPLLSRIDLKQKKPQILVLAPTRELAIQVAEAFSTYAKDMKGFNVLPIYGGQDYRTQLRQLERGAHVVVGTPGRVMDHMRRGSLKLDELCALVLDEADEMLRMGFIDDVEWILQQTPENHQTALFSATMPPPIKKITTKYLRDPVEVTIKVTTTTASTITQRYWQVKGFEKLEILTRILEGETFDGIIVFVRTKNATVEVAEKLQARGFAAEALNGDIAQNQREKTVSRLKKGHIDILVATDVAARGLDVDRISHVINYDIPYDTESYVHRIGRTGRAGREGQAILFVTARERRMLSVIENATKRKIEKYQFPSTDTLNQRKTEQLFAQIDDELKKNLAEYIELMTKYQQENLVDPIEIAAAFASISQNGKPFLLKDMNVDFKNEMNNFGAERKERTDRKERSDRKPGRKSEFSELGERKRGDKTEKHNRDDVPMIKYRLDVGSTHGAQKGDIVGAIANEAGIDSKFMGRITLNDDHSYIELPEGMPKEVFTSLKKIWIKGQKINISEAKSTGAKNTDARSTVKPPAKPSIKSSTKPSTKPAKKSSTSSSMKPRRKPKG